MRKRLIVLLFSLALVTQSRGQGQISVQAANPTEQAAPDEKLYQFFFVKHAFLASRAAEKERRGISAAHVRRLLADEIGLDSAEATVLDQVAQDALSEMRAIDQEARRIMQEADGGQQKYHALPPPLPPELLLLQAKRNAVFANARLRLRGALTEPSFAKLDAYIRATVHVRGRSFVKQ